MGPSGTLFNFIHTFDGTDQTVTEIHSDQESSIPVTPMPFWLVDKVAPDGSQVTEIKYKRTSGTGTWTVFERSMTMIKIEDGDLSEAGSATDDADVTTDAKQIDDMIITDPGVDEYMVVFGASQGFGTLGTAPGPFVDPKRRAVLAPSDISLVVV